MADKKVEKALYGPSTLEVALGALLGLLLGVVLAGVYLVAKPVQTVKELPAEPAKGAVYYVAGKVDPTRGRGFDAKQKAFVAGGQVAVSEEELNAWAASLGAAAPGAPAQPAPAAANEFLSASGLNFRLVDGRLQVAQKVLLNYFGLSKEVMMVATGGFERAGEGFVFRAESLYLGSCPLHALPGAGNALARALTARAKVSDDFRAAWAKLTAIAVEDNLLKATTQP